MIFEEYVRLRGAHLVRFAYVLSGDQHSAEDLVQTAFAHVLARWHRISGADHPDRYMQRVVVSLYLQSRRRRASSEVITAELKDLPTAGGDIASRTADRDQVCQLLATLTPKARAIVVLRFYLDWDDQTIAEFVGTAQGTVRSSLSRSLSTLRLQASNSSNTGDNS